jgi:hypothetical protein
MGLRRQHVDIVTDPEQCETGCGTRVAVTRTSQGATRLSQINDDGSVAPGPHDGGECRARRGL